MNKNELIHAIQTNPEKLITLVQDVIKQLTLEDLKQLLTIELCEKISKLKLNSVLSTLMEPYYPQSLPFYKNIIDKVFVEHKQFQQTLLLDYLTQVIQHMPNEVPQHVIEADKLVQQLKNNDVNVRLVKAQTLQIHYHLLIGNLQKAKTLLITVRAHKIHLSKEVQQRLDYISGCTMLYCAEYIQAANYFAESELYVQQAMCLLLSGSYNGVEKVTLAANKSADVSDEVRKTLYKLFEIAMLLSTPRHLTQLREVVKVLKKQCTDFEMQFALNKLVQIEVEKQVLKVLKPYTKIEISYLSTLTDVEEGELFKLLSMLIVNGQLDYIIDGQTGCLLKNVISSGTSEQLLRDANELITALNKWIK